MRIFTILLNALLLFSLFPWVLLLFLSAFLFDSPTSTSNPYVWFTAWSIWSYPALVILGSMKAFKQLGERNTNRALKWTALSVSAPSLIFIAFTLLG